LHEVLACLPDHSDFLISRHVDQATPLLVLYNLPKRCFVALTVGVEDTDEVGQAPPTPLRYRETVRLPHAREVQIGPPIVFNLQLNEGIRVEQLDTDVSGVDGHAAHGRQIAHMSLKKSR
jgi:hypothetical protein